MKSVKNYEEIYDKKINDNESYVNNPLVTVGKVEEAVLLDEISAELLEDIASAKKMTSSQFISVLIHREIEKELGVPSRKVS